MTNKAKTYKDAIKKQGKKPVVALSGVSVKPKDKKNNARVPNFKPSARGR